MLTTSYFVSRLLADTLWLCAVCYYLYVTFLGYTSEHLYDSISHGDTVDGSHNHSLRTGSGNLHAGQLLFVLKT